MEELNRLRSPKFDIGSDPDMAKLNMEMLKNMGREDKEGKKEGGKVKGKKVRGCGIARKGIRAAKMR